MARVVNGFDSPTQNQLINQIVLAFTRHWLGLFNLVMGTFVVLPWLAPVFMAQGYETPARIIYFGYSFTCHQLPQRSYFLLGDKLMYSQAEIQAVWPSDNLLVERQFIGTPTMGYKVAYSDRMVSMYTGMFIGGLLFGLMRRLLHPLNWRLFVLVGVIPIFVDGFTHMLNDLTGLGFRDNHMWLAALTSASVSTTFMSGDAIGSLNWWLRLVTGLLFGVTVVWFTFPYVQREMSKAGAALAPLMGEATPTDAPKLQERAS
jgi:uncharacterized membrane protein